jgi:hypothetical protein
MVLAIDGPHDGSDWRIRLGMARGLAWRRNSFRTRPDLPDR